MYDESSCGEIRRPEHDELPGRPRKSLVKKVRSVLFQNVRCRPHRTDEAWRLAWEWASACADRADLWRFGKRRSLPWPQPNEIASQYLLLALARMREVHQLRLPMYAGETVPTAITERFGAIGRSGHATLIEHSGSAPTTAGERPDLTA